MPWRTTSFLGVCQPGCFLVLLLTQFVTAFNSVTRVCCWRKLPSSGWPRDITSNLLKIPFSLETGWQNIGMWFWPSGPVHRRRKKILNLVFWCNILFIKWSFTSDCFAATCQVKCCASNQWFGLQICKAWCWRFLMNLEKEWLTLTFALGMSYLMNLLQIPLLILRSTATSFALHLQLLWVRTVRALRNKETFCQFNPFFKDFSNHLLKHVSKDFQHIFRNPGAQPYFIKPKATPLYFGFNELTGNFKYSNCASCFTVAASWSGIVSRSDCCFWIVVLIKILQSSKSKDLDASKTLMKAWRVTYQKEANESGLLNCVQMPNPGPTYFP